MYTKIYLLTAFKSLSFMAINPYNSILNAIVSVYAFFLNGIISLNERLLQDELMCYWLIRLKWEFDNFYLFLDERIVTRAKDYQSSK